MAPGQFFCDPAHTLLTTTAIKRLRFLYLLLYKPALSEPVKKCAWRALSDTSRQRSTLAFLCSAVCNAVCHWRCHGATTSRYLLAFGPPNPTGLSDCYCDQLQRSAVAAAAAPCARSNRRVARASAQFGVHLVFTQHVRVRRSEYVVRIAK